MKTINGWNPLYISGYGLADVIGALPNDVEGVEIGVDSGVTTAWLLDACPNISRLHAVDPWTEYMDYHGLVSQATVDARHANAMNNIASQAHRVNVMKMPSTNAAAEFAPASLDFIFIDGCHLYEVVVEDIETWYPKMKPGAIFAGHDWTLPTGGPQRAVNEFRAKHSITAELKHCANDVWYWVVP